MVRLKVFGNKGFTVQSFRFQFQYGAIKRQKEHNDRNGQTCFNSNMVRLKAVEELINKIADLKFQFQYGAIKRKKAILSNSVFIMFQFQYGAIKRKHFLN